MSASNLCTQTARRTCMYIHVQCTCASRHTDSGWPEFFTLPGYRDCYNPIDCANKDLAARYDRPEDDDFTPSYASHFASSSIFFTVALHDNAPRKCFCFLCVVMVSLCVWSHSVSHFHFSIVSRASRASSTLSLWKNKWLCCPSLASEDLKKEEKRREE